MGTWIEKWDPEDQGFWQREGKKVARRNLIWSILAENIGFSVWLLWSVVATRLPKVGFKYATDELFTLVATAGLVGACMRFPYTFAVPKFGGRNWTIVSALLLFIPTTLLAVLVQRPDTPYWMMQIAAATAGLGGGNFASSMANISFFYPDKEKGFALGLNAAGGNVGVSVVQLLVPIVITIGAPLGALNLQNAGYMWMPLIVISTLGAIFFMNNLATAKSNFADQVGVMKNKHTWIMSWLYIGTFGSFIGFSAAFPLLLTTQFPEAGTGLAFLGPLVGSVARPLGGWLSDKTSGTKVTTWVFVVMGVATALLVPIVKAHAFVPFVGVFLVLFTASGIGNGSTFRMIPVVFRREAMSGIDESDAAARAEAMRAARRDAAAVIGLSSAIGALGGYFIPRSFGASLKATGSPALALGGFLAFYATCLILTYVQYVRVDRSAPALVQA